MKRFFRSEAGATVLWVVGSILLAAVIVPWIYQMGRGFGKVAGEKELPGILEWIGRSCRDARFSRFFSRSLLLSALVLLPWMLRRVRVVRAKSLLSSEKGREISWSGKLAQMVTGLLISGCLLWTLGMLLHHWGAYVVSPKQVGTGKLVGSVLVPAVAASLIEEWLFRGLLLGLWLRFSRPLAACVGTSLFFALIHFLEPPRGTVIADPTSPVAGFELLGKIIFHLVDPRFFVTDFATLFVIGMILAWARLKTGALWFPIGLHAGWIVAFKGYNLYYRGVPTNGLHPWGIGDSLRSGLLPMLTLAVTALFCHFVFRRYDPKRALG